jgi:SAM-dependent methyltransferase
MDPKDIVRSGYDKISHIYRGDAIDSSNPDHVRYAHWVSELQTLLPAHAAVLDLGCGNGLPTAKLLVDAGCAVTGVDISPVQIVRARALVSQAQFICADMTELAFPENSFAAIISFYAIIHVPLTQQPALFSNIGRWLQPGGYLMATVGADAWTGTEENWLEVADALMYWSHADAATYQQWLEHQGFSIHWTRFIPEGQSGHTLIFAQRAL